MNKKPIAKFIMSLFMILSAFTFMSSKVNASEHEPSVTFILSDELIDSGYRMAGCNANSIQCFYNGNTSIGIENKLADNHRVSGYPAVNNGINWETVDVEFRVNGVTVSQPVLMSDNKYHPKPIDFFRDWEDGTVFVAYFRKATINYYDGSDLLHSETLIVGNDATDYIAQRAETDEASYSFTKWVDEQGNDADLTNIQFDTNVYAQFSETPKFSVSFMADGQTLTTSKVLKGNRASTPQTPTKADMVTEDDENTYHITYTFAYWNVNQKETDPAGYDITEDTIFEAVFKEEVTATKKMIPAPIEPSNPTNVGGPAQPANPVDVESMNAVQNQISTITAPRAIAAVASNNDTVSVTPVMDHTQDQVLSVNNTEQQTVIQDAETPLAAPAEASAWSLINLLCMALTIILGIYMVNKKDENQNVSKKAATVIMFIISAVIFFLTQNLTAAMGMVDSWTIVMILILAMQTMLTFSHKQQEYKSNFHSAVHE